jgi:hypothetical protein
MLGQILLIVSSLILISSVVNIVPVVGSAMAKAGGWLGMFGVAFRVANTVVGVILPFWPDLVTELSMSRV